MVQTAKMEKTSTFATSSSTADAPRPELPSQKTREDFKKAMEEHAEDDSSGKDEEGKGESGNDQSMPSAASLFSSLFDGKMQTLAAPSAGPPPDDLVADLANEVAQRILVSDLQAGQPTEIRVQISASILPDTEIVLQRGPDGLLTVLLETSNVSSRQTLVAAQHTLHEQLEKHGPVSVRVGSTERSDQSDNDANRRSRGWVGYDPYSL